MMQLFTEIWPCRFGTPYMCVANGSSVCACSVTRDMADPCPGGPGCRGAVPPLPVRRPGGHLHQACQGPRLHLHGRWVWAHLYAVNFILYTESIVYA